MKRKLLACTTSLMLLLSILLVSNVNAHPVTLIDPGTGLYDSSRTEWFGTQNGEPPDAGTGMIERDSTNRGEFVFNDAVDKKVDPNPALNDHRVVTGTTELTKSTDLDWFAITGDASNIYFLAKVDAIRGVTLPPIPELMVSIDTGAGGNTALPGGVGVNVNAAAAWDYVIQTDFTSTTTPPPGAQRPPKRWTTTSVTGGACAGCQAQLVGASNGGSPGSFIEIKVPWGTIGGKPTPDKSLRFTATVYRKDHQHPNDGFTSALIDAASTKKSIEILSQDGGTVNTYFDLHFDANGEVFSPVLISEFQPNPSGTEPGVNGTEWIEIYNPNNFSVDLSQYKIGDAAHKGGASEAMLKFPNSTSIAANGVVIVVGDKNVFNAKFPGTPGTILGQNQLSVYSAWATGTTIGLDNQRDQIMLLDGTDTIADFVEYTYQGSTQANFVNSVPITFPPAGAPDGNIYSYERCPAANDTNNADVDFLTHDGFAG